MYNLCRRLSIAISVSTLAFGFNSPVVAKPLTQSRLAIVSQANNTDINQISPPPIEAILANVRIKPALQPKIVKLNQRQGITKSVAKLTRSKRSKIVVRPSYRNRPSSAATNLFNIDRVNSRNDNFTAVNRLIE